MPAATNDVFATWKISTRDSGVFVRYSSPVPPFAFALKMASAILPPWGSPRDTPATTCVESARGVPFTTPLIVEKAQLRATAPSHAYPSTITVVGKIVSNAPRFIVKRRTTSVRSRASTSLRLSRCRW